jgi:hypothetical protein
MGEPVYYFPLPEGVLTELRVHGVSGPDPAAVLETPAVFHVAGDSITGFARRRSGDQYGPADVVAPGVPDRRLEAFSWRGVSSGAASRGLWLLLAPFAFVNFAAWMHPPVPKDGGGPGTLRADPWNAKRVMWFHTLLRIFALTLTLVFTLTALAALLDVPSHPTRSDATQTCPYWMHTKCGVVYRAGGVVAAFAVLALLATLAAVTWQRYDAHPAPERDTPGGSPLEMQTFWGTKNAVRRQHLLHLAAAAGLIVWIAAQPRIAAHYDAHTVRAVRAASLLVLVAVLLLAALPPFSMRRDLNPPPLPAGAPPPPAPPVEPAPTGTQYSDPTLAGGFLAGLETLLANAVDKKRWLWALGAVVVAAILVWLVWPDPHLYTSGNPPSPGATPPPILDPFSLKPTLTALLLAQAVLLLGLIASVNVMAVKAWAYRDPLHARLLFWQAGWLVPAMAWLVAAVSSAAVVFASTKLFKRNEHHVFTAGFTVLTSYAGVTFLAGLAATLVLVAFRVVWCIANFPTDLVTDRIDRPSRRGSYRVACGLATVARTGYLAFVPLALAGLAGLSWTIVVLLPDKPTPLKVNAPTAILALLLGALPLAVRAAMAKTGTRRGVGILWDVVTFWPRAAHPFGPPCYAERAIPQLRDRHSLLVEAIGGDVKQRRVLMSAHSQGAVISAAMLLQQSDDECNRTALLTYGCQYSYLFARGFPAYLGGQVLDRLADRMAVGKAPGRWLNLYRLTDYLGSHVQLSARFPDINREVADPGYARPWPLPAPVPLRFSLQRPGPRDLPGDLIASTSPLRHSDYPASYEYHQAVLQLDATIP